MNQRSSSQPDKPTPAPRGRPSLPVQPGQPYLRREDSYSSSPGGSHGGTTERVSNQNKVNQSPLIRSREITPNHSRQGSGQNLRYLKNFVFWFFGYPVIIIWKFEQGKNPKVHSTLIFYSDIHLKTVFGETCVLKV